MMCDLEGWHRWHALAKYIILEGSFAGSGIVFAGSKPV